MTATIALSLLGIAALTFGIIALFLALVICGRCIGADRCPEDPPPASWLAKMRGELG